MKIALFEVEEWEQPTFEPLSGAHEVRFVAEPLNEENVAAHPDVEILSTFIYSDLDEPTLRRLEALRMIATRSTGVDHIAMDYCRERGVTVANVPTYGKNTVAEHVFALLLAISHHIVEAVNRTARGDFSQAGLRGFDLLGKTIGIVGTGDIGRYTARIAKGFGMNVLAFDVKPDPEAARELGFRYVDMNELLGASDVVTLHVPGGPATRHLISKQQFDAMKPGVVLINTARGSVVDVEGLLRALSEGKVAAAALDVLPEEPTVREEAELLRSYFRRAHNLDALLADHVLLRMRNVVITPHTAFNTREAVQRILDTTHQNIAAYLKGESTNVVS